MSEHLNRAKAEPHEALPKLVQDAYMLLGADWRETQRQWKEAGHHLPPVMLTVCNRTETAARVEHYFNKGDSHSPELNAPNKTLRVDSKVLDKAEIGEKYDSSDKELRARLKSYEEHLFSIIKASSLPETRKQQLLGMKKEELLREIVDIFGKRGAVGQDLQNVISVAMLSEGWIAKNVTHIMGLRAFTSQLLCEQVVGRGLRRVSYDTDENGLFLPEYVNVFGVPLSISETGEGGDCCTISGPGRDDFDLAVIGAGSAEFSAAITAAEAGKRVVLIGHGLIGGTCVNIGCVLSKTMIRAAKAIHGAKVARQFPGLSGSAQADDWAALMNGKKTLVSGLRQKKYADLLPGYEGITYIDDRGCHAGRRQREGKRARNSRAQDHHRHGRTSICSCNCGNN